jgi:exo-beta-1,3-glucanase (GH17 family)
LKNWRQLICAISFGIALLSTSQLVAAAPKPFRGLAYNPSGVTAFTDLEAGISEARIRADLTHLSPLTDEVRTYSASYGLDRVPAIAASLGLKVTLGIWLGRDKAVTDAEIAKAVAAVKANPHTVTRVIVGNEPLYRKDASVEGIIAAMAKVRRGIAGMRIPVGTAETWTAWRDNPALAQGSDFISVHIIPYWDGVASKDAPAYVMARYDEITRAFPGKPIVLGETGWPSSGPARQSAVPSIENQIRFAEDFAGRARKQRVVYFLIEAYDQPWKAASEGDTPLWGFFDTRGKAKSKSGPFGGR